MKRSALHLRRPAFREGRPAFVVSERQGAVAIAVVHFSDDGRVVFFVAARAIACGLRGGFSYASMLLVLEKWYLFRDGSATMAVLQRRQASVRIRALSIGGEQGPFFMPELFSCLLFFASSSFAAVSRTFPYYFRERRALSGVLCVRFVAVIPFAVYCAPLTICY